MSERRYPSVGVVVAVRDGAPTLAAAIRSVLEQVPRPDRVVVIDGRSTDGSRAIAEALAARHRELMVVDQVGTGLGGARNEGVALLDTEAVAFCDSDDVWTVGSLATRLDVLADDVRTVAVVGKVVAAGRAESPQPGWTPGALLVRREAFGVVGRFDDTIAIGADSDWLIRLSTSGLGVEVIDEVVLTKGVRPSSLSTDVATYRAELLQVARDHIDRARGRPRRRDVRVADRHVVHLIPRCFGGGPERSMMTLAATWRRQGISSRSTAVVLDQEISTAMLVAASRSGVEILHRPPDSRLRDVVESADVVIIDFWNHPLLVDLLHRVELPPARVIAWASVRGTTAPQVLPAGLGDCCDELWLTTAASRDSPAAVQARRRGVPVEVVLPLLDTNRLAGTVDRSRRDELVVGYLGSYSPTKVHPRLPELFHAVAEAMRLQHPGVDVRFELHGGGGDPRELEARFAELGMAGRATVRGATEDVGAAFAAWDVLAYPLRPGGYATADRVVQEAMWVGLPVVVLDDGAVATLVDHMSTGLVAPDEDAFVAEVVRLLGDPGLRSAISAASAGWARDRFDPVDAASRIDDRVAGLLRSPRTHHPRLAAAASRPAELFVAALDRCAGPFAASLVASAAGVDEADLEIAALGARTGVDAHPFVLSAEGGLVHYRNTFADDALLRLWSGLVAAGGGDHELAAVELAAAGRLGDERGVRYAGMLTEIERRTRRRDGPATSTPR
jgi:glycosyltransferase involved in cell wall biosynthesis